MASRPNELTARTAVVTASAQIVARTASLLLVLASTAILTRAVGVGVFADWITVLSLLAMLGFALDPAISPVVVRRLHQSEADAPAPRSMLFVRIALSLVAATLVVIVAVVLRGADTLLLALVLAGQLVPRALVLNVGAYLQAQHRLHRQSNLEVITSALGLLALAVGALIGTPPAVLAALGFTLPAVLLAFLMQRELQRLSGVRLTPRSGEDRLVRNVLREAAPLAGAVVLVSLYTRINVVFVNEVEDALGVASFLFAFQFVEQLIVVAAIIATTLLPMLAARGRTRDLTRDHATHEVLIGVGLLGAAVTTALALASPVLVRLIGGDELEPASDYLVLLAPMGVALFLNFMTAYLLTALELGRRYLVYNAIALAVNLAANSTLTLSEGAAAAARIAWATELLVVGMALGPVLRTSSSGRLTLIGLTTLCAISVAASEAIAHGVPRALPAAIGLACSLGGGAILIRRRSARIADMAR